MRGGQQQTVVLQTEGQFEVRGQQKTFALYSVGWNGPDEGGTTCLDPSDRPWVREGDWVWQQEFPPHISCRESNLGEIIRRGF